MDKIDFRRIALHENQRNATLHQENEEEVSKEKVNGQRCDIQESSKGYFWNFEVDYKWRLEFAEPCWIWPQRGQDDYIEEFIEKSWNFYFEWKERSSK